MENTENNFVWRINHGGYIDLSNPKKNALYTNAITQKGTKISKSLAVRRVIERLIKEGNPNRARDLRNIFYNPELSDNSNYLKIEFVKKELPKKLEPNKEQQLELQFGPTIPLNIKEAFKRSLNEMMSADVEGVASTHGGSVGNDDFYARGDSRIPKSIFGGIIFKRPDIERHKHKKRKRIKKHKKRL